MSLSLRTTQMLRLPKPSFGGTVRALSQALRRLERASALRRELDRMDDRMLSDIGVSRAQLMFEADRDV
jgi:uncharacterized protein YjiS (DUF1127 family)